MSVNLFARVLDALRETDPSSKVVLARALKVQWEADGLALDDTAPVVPIRESATATSLSRDPHLYPIGDPGRPERPVLVSPLAVERRSVHTREGRAALIHALAHIEFNAINLALDAVYRFRVMPREYYGDWLTVAAEEAYHFTLLRDHLASLGHDYGDFAAHNGLWEMAVKTAHDPLVRMALVPRVLEARGLDASPALVRKLEAAGDQRAVEILNIILRDEIGHVRIGNRWYAHLCAQRGLDPIATFQGLVREFGAPRLRPPFHTAARRAAGFSDRELALLEQLAAERQAT